MASPVVAERKSYLLRQRSRSERVYSGTAAYRERLRGSAALVQPTISGATGDEWPGRAPREDARATHAWQRRRLRVALARQFAAPLTPEQQDELAVLRSIQDAAAREMLSRAAGH
jgi:hypothetical protein